MQNHKRHKYEAVQQVGPNKSSKTFYQQVTHVPSPTNDPQQVNEK